MKAYFKQQGLSQRGKKWNRQYLHLSSRRRPSSRMWAQSQQLTQAQAVAQKAMIDSAATMTAVSLGIDAKTIPYVLKMADLSQVMGQDGKNQ